jgi:hypothetical protein
MPRAGVNGHVIETASRRSWDDGCATDGQTKSLSASNRQTWQLRPGKGRQ